MPLLNSREAATAALLQSARAVQLQTGLMSREAGLPAGSFSRTTDIKRPSLLGLSGGSTGAVSVSPGFGTSPGTRGAGMARGIETLRVECGNPGCSGGWTPPWKSRRYPFFEGKWGCSPKCVIAMVRVAIAREMGDSVRDLSPEIGAASHRHRIPLGLVMLAQGWITHPQLRKALQSQRLNGSGRIGDWLVSECGLRAEWITRGLSVQWNCPVLTTEGFSPETMARALPRAFVEEYGILPVRIAGRKILYVGFEDNLDASSAFAVEQMSGLRTECGVIGESRYRKARELLLGCRFVDVSRSVVADRDALARSIERVVAQRHPVSAKLVRLHKYYWLRLWQERDDVGRGPNQLPSPGDAADFLFTIGS